jgi:hypothetical protein
MSSRAAGEDAFFVVARNSQEVTRLPYLLRLPLEGGLILKARASWPAAARVYCHRFEEPWPGDADIVEQTPVLACHRRGAAIDLVLDRPRLSRSQFVFTQVKGREAIFWQTQKTARAANPGGRIPRRRSLAEPVTIAVDTRERYPLPLRTARRGDGARDRFRRRLRNPLARRETAGRRRAQEPRQPRQHALRRNARLPTPTAGRAAARRGCCRGPDTRRSSSSNTSTAAGSPTSSHASRSATPKSRSSSPTPAATPRNGPPDSSPQRWPTPPTPTRTPNTLSRRLAPTWGPERNRNLRALHGWITGQSILANGGNSFSI